MNIRNFYLLEELRRCDKKLEELNSIQINLIKFYFTTAFAVATITVTLINYKLFGDENILVTWFLLLPLLLYTFITWFTLKKILIQYEYYENKRNQMSDLFQDLNKYSEFKSPFIYFYSLISWLFIINLFAFTYNAIPFLSKMPVSTYIVIIIVIFVLVVLATGSTLALNSARKKARDAKRISDVRQVQTALELYYNDNSNYPIANSFNDLTKYLSKQANSIYISVLPADPVNKNDYVYGYKSLNGASYEINYKLENGGNMKADPHGFNNKC